MSAVLRIVRHDLRLVLRNRKLLGSAAWGMGIVLILVLANLKERTAEEVLPLFFFLFVAAGVAIPIALAVNAIVGEKERGTMEPLLLLPISESQLVAGKVGVTLLAGLAGVALVAVISGGTALWLFPNSAFEILGDPRILYTLFVIAPLTVIPFSLLALSVSARSPDAQTASATSLIVLVPVWAVLFGVWMGVVAVNRDLLAAMTLVLFLLSVLAFRIAIWAVRPEALIQRRT